MHPRLLHAFVSGGGLADSLDGLGDLVRGRVRVRARVGVRVGVAVGVGVWLVLGWDLGLGVG